MQKHKIGMALALACILLTGCTGDQEELVQLDDQQMPLAAPIVITQSTTPLQGFSLMEVNGDMVSTKSYKDKILVINFWDTGTDACKDMFQVLGTAAQVNSDVQILCVNVSEGTQAVQEYLDAYPIAFPVLMDDTGAVSRKNTINILPTTMVVDTQGQIRFTAEGLVSEQSLQKMINDIR